MDFVYRNLKDAPAETREMAYRTIAHPQVEYCSTMWDTYTVSDSHRVEMVQFRAARFVLCHCDNTSSINAMLTQLGWETLQVRRANVSLVLLYKATRQLIVLDTLAYLVP